MLAEDHSKTSQDFLTAARREFLTGDRLQASEKMWGAASHAVMAVCQERGWADGSHRALKNAVEQLAVEQDDPLIALGFGIAEKFHRNFYHDNMEEFELNADRPKVDDFVTRMLALLSSSA